MNPADLRNLLLKELSAAASVDFRGALNEAVETLVGSRQGRVWRTMPDYPVVRDDSGNENNLLSVN